MARVLDKSYNYERTMLHGIRREYNQRAACCYFRGGPEPPRTARVSTRVADMWHDYQIRHKMWPWTRTGEGELFKGVELIEDPGMTWVDWN